MDETPIYKFAIREDLHDVAEKFLPTRATSRATGWDVCAAIKDRNSLNISFGQYVKIPLGFRSFVPEGWWYELKPRSSTFGNKNLHSLYGTIDEDFQGELLFACQYLPNLAIQSHGRAWNFDKLNFLVADKEYPDLKIKFGDAIGQIIPIRRQEMIVEDISNEEFDSLCKRRNAERGDGGFGSSDSKRKKYNLIINQ